jgi:hypothetical protein
MFRRQDSGSDVLIVSLFCDPFAAVAAVRQLTTMGVAEDEIDLVGFMGTQVPDWNPFFFRVGLSVSQADYVREEFEDGAVMVVIRASGRQPKKSSALKVLREYGGVLPQESYLQPSRGAYEPQ